MEIDMYAKGFKNIKKESLGSLKIFLCHSSGDKAAVRKLYKRLNVENFNPWLDEEDLLPGQEWQIEIPKEVKKSDIVIVCLSRSSINKEGYIQKEIKYALDAADEKPEGTIFIIPLKLEECNVPDRLSRWHWVNLYEDNGFEKLMRSLQKRNNQLEKKDIAYDEGKHPKAMDKRNEVLNRVEEKEEKVQRETEEENILRKLRQMLNANKRLSAIAIALVLFLSIYVILTSSEEPPISNGTPIPSITGNTILPWFINGTVVDSTNKMGIVGVKIFINDNKSTLTNTTGFYSFEVNSGTYNLISTFDPKYYSKSTKVTTTNSSILVQDIKLVEKPTGDIRGSVVYV